MIDAIYCLSLERLKERRDKVINTLRDIHFCDVYLVDAVDGYSFDFGDFYNEGIYEYKEWKLSVEQSQLQTNSGSINMIYWQREVNKGEIGCGLSHFLAWKHAHELKLERVLFLEDDFYFNYHEFIHGLEIFNTFAKYRLCDIFYLGSKPLIDGTPIDENIIQCNYTYLLHAYILQKDAIRVLVNGNYLSNIITPDEYVPASYCLHPRSDIRKLYKFEKRLSAYRLKTDVVHQNDSGGSQTF